MAMNFWYLLCYPTQSSSISIVNPPSSLRLLLAALLSPQNCSLLAELVRPATMVQAAYNSKVRVPMPLPLRNLHSACLQENPDIAALDLSSSAWGDNAIIDTSPSSPLLPEHIPQNFISDAALYSNVSSCEILDEPAETAVSHEVLSLECDSLNPVHHLFLTIICRREKVRARASRIFHLTIRYSRIQPYLTNQAQVSLPRMAQMNIQPTTEPISDTTLHNG
jgi:hypothetical protein